jgi:hypothetical protein
MKKYHASSAHPLISSKDNLPFDKLLVMSDKQFKNWTNRVREEILRAWDEDGIPPKGGSSDDKIRKDFQNLIKFDTDSVLQSDQGVGDKNCLVPVGAIGSSCNAFFPNMQKTRDTTTKDHTGVSSYDIYSDGAKFDTLLRNFDRLFRQDCFYDFSSVVNSGNPGGGITESSGKRWIKKFQQDREGEYQDFDFWIDPKKWKPQGKNKRPLTITTKEIKAFRDDGLIQDHNIPGIDLDKSDAKHLHRIRVYQKDKKVFPKAMIRLDAANHVAPGTNFPPTVSKFIYKRFTDDLLDQDRIVIYDPSSGFGGRILGALSLNLDRQIHYVGTDPNPDNYLEPIRRTRYENLGRWFNSEIRRRFKTTYEIFRLGSEVIHKEPDFQKYKGQFDFVFTSPPYFAAEAYSQDENQSFKKFPEYDSWVAGFLRQTLITAVEYLKPQRFLAFNIADIHFGDTYYPLEHDTREILKSLGMEQKPSLKLVLATGPGGGQVDKFSGTPTTKNFCQVGGDFRKYEPVMVYWKP